MTEDLYEILGVDRNASPDEVKSAYRKMARKYHPDANPDDPDAEENFKRVAGAYEVLSDPQKKAAYDRYGTTKGFGGAGSPFGGAGSVNVGDFGDLFDILGSMFGGGAARGGGRRASRGADLRMDLEISFEEAALGAKKEVEIPTFDECDTCDGSGAAPGSQPITCTLCGGTGQMRQQQGFFVMARPCTRCGATGTYIDEPCPTCKQSGFVQGTTNLEVDIPPGVRENQKLRWEGRGAPGSPGAPRGDLYIVIRLEEHSLFEREGDDLLCTVPISFTVAALGGKIDVPTLEGKVKMTVPAGTQSGRVLRLKKKGFPSVGGGTAGDQLVTLVVETPVNLTDRQKELLEELAELSGEEVHPESKGFFARMKELFD